VRHSLPSAHQSFDCPWYKSLLHNPVFSLVSHLTQQPLVDVTNVLLQQTRLAKCQQLLIIQAVTSQRNRLCECVVARQVSAKGSWPNDLFPGTGSRVGLFTSQQTQTTNNNHKYQQLCIRTSPSPSKSVEIIPAIFK